MYEYNWKISLRSLVLRRKEEAEKMWSREKNNSSKVKKP